MITGAGITYEMWDTLCEFGATRYEMWDIYGIRWNVSHMRCGIHYVCLGERGMRYWILDTGYAMWETS